eukprot:m.301049 g.301049  ORF g.301049 m.301049 type:complete len:600 (+) comp20136_c0_seq3:252-2051(+)
MTLRWEGVVSFGVLAHFFYVNITSAISFSNVFRQKTASYHTLQSGLHRGWLPFWAVPEGVRSSSRDGSTSLMDLKDGQYHGFRDNLIILTQVFVGLILGRWFIDALAGLTIKKSNQWNSRIRYYAAFSIIFVSIMHGTDVAYMFSFAAVNFGVSELCALQNNIGRVGVALTWILCCSAVLLNEWHHGYGPFPFRRLPLVGPVLWGRHAHEPHVAALTPWHHRFPLAVLRMVSFNMDRFWRRRERASGTTEQYIRSPFPRRVPAVVDLGDAAAASACGTQMHCMEPDPARSHGNACYSALAYIAYVFYPPLYLAGPILTFNAFVACTQRVTGRVPMRFKVAYVARALFALVAYEVFLHYFFIGAIANQPTLFQTLFQNPVHCVTYAYVGVNFLYLKFLVMWRFFRMWAVLDDIVPPENMPVCITTTTTIRNFWRGWHSSFNGWLKRYMYIPLGGSMPRGSRVCGVVRTACNTALVFTFVAVWHDQSLSLLSWGWIGLVSLIPEGLALAVLAQHQEAWWHGVMQTLLSVYSIVFLILANLVGFSVGLKGVGVMLDTLLRAQHLPLAVGVVAHLFVLARVNIAIQRQRDRVRQRLKASLHTS